PRHLPAGAGHAAPQRLNRRRPPVNRSRVSTRVKPKHLARGVSSGSAAPPWTLRNGRPAPGRSNTDRTQNPSRAVWAPVPDLAPGPTASLQERVGTEGPTPEVALAARR